ncbi:MAG: ADOP family duplicated permease [Bryobacteraceae bacterium]
MNVGLPWARLKGLMRRRESDAELQDEIATHLELAAAENLRRGMPPEEARRLAAVRFGSVTSAKEGVWEVRGLPGLASCLRDARYAIRGMRSNPGFTLVTVATLALGIGLCSVLFSVLNAFVLRPAPGVSDASRLVALEAPVPYPYFQRYRDEKGLSAGMAAFIGPVPFGVSVDAQADGKPERVFGHLVSLEYFSTLGVAPLLGRFFDPAQETPGAAPTVVVSARFWRMRLHADPHVIGRALRVNGRQATIIGVGPKDFLGIFPSTPAEVFLPVTADPAVAPELADDILHRTTQPAFRVLVRLRPGMTMAATEARLDAHTREIDQQTGKRGSDRKGRQVHLILAGQASPLSIPERTLVVTFYTLLVALIFSLTCSNLAGLILARGSARSREIAIRLSIGASRFRVIRQLLTESLMLAALGGVAGFAAAYGLLDLLTRFSSDSALGQPEIAYTPDLRVALFAFLISALAGAGFGLLPALATTRADLASALKASMETRRSRYRRFGLRNLFVVYQVAAAMMLILIMGVWSGGLRNAANLDPGFAAAPLQFFSLDPARDGLTPDQSAAVFTGFAQRLARLPGVEGVTLADRPPLTPAIANSSVSVPSVPAGSRVSVHPVAFLSIGPGYFATLGASLVRGVEFSERDLGREAAPSDILPAVINQTAAKDLFGGADPLGRRIRQDAEGVQRTFQVIGVVRYDRRSLAVNRPVATIFLPFTRKDLRRGSQSGTIVLLRARTHLVGASIRRELASINPNLTMFNPQTMREFLAAWNRVVQTAIAFTSGVGLFGLLLACVGLAGVTAQAVERRRKEIGIRMALGARPPQVVRLVMREGAVMISAGAAVGFAGAYGISRVMAAASAQVAEIIGWSTGNRALTVGIPLLLVSLAAIACYLPARRSISLDPLVALREE